MRCRIPTLIALAFVLGCGADDGLGRRYPVHGSVKYKGRPLATGSITFEPITADGPARVATGTIRDGAYTLSTTGGDVGALPGTYRVAIVSRAADSSKKVRGITEEGAGRQSDVIKATRTARNLIPPKYMSSYTSGLDREVKAATNRFDFDLVD